LKKLQVAKLTDEPEAAAKKEYSRRTLKEA
jgi:hypothetical protein